MVTRVWLGFELSDFCTPSQKKPQDWLCLIQRNEPFFPGAVTGIEWENLHCQQSNCLQKGLCCLSCSIFSSLCFLARLGSVTLFLQPHLSYFFPFFHRFSTIDNGVALQSQLLEAAGAGGDPRVGSCLFLTPLGLLGHETGIFWMQSRGLNPISSPNCCFPIPGAKLVPGVEGSFASAGPEGVREALRSAVALQ